MNSTVYSIVLITFSTICFAQNSRDLQSNNEWSEGSILLNDGKEIKGLVRYNDKNDLLFYQNASDERSFTARSVLGFEFFDDVSTKQRVFYSLPYVDPKTSRSRSLFFEVLRDMKSFAVISRFEPVEIEQNSTYVPNNSVNQNKNWSDPINKNQTQWNDLFSSTTTITHAETVYFLNERGEIEPFIKITNKVIDGTFFDRKKKKSKIVDSGLLKKYFLEPGYSKMMIYINENDLDIEEKDDFLKLLDVYEDAMN